MTKKDVAALRERLIEHALSLPEVTKDFPWGELVTKVRKKVFVFFGSPTENEGGFGMSVKLPASAPMALSLPFAEPTGYGLGRSGWVTLRFKPKEMPPEEMLLEWVDESYMAVAPKRVAQAMNAANKPAKKPVKKSTKTADKPGKKAAKKPGKTAEGPTKTQAKKAPKKSAKVRR